LHPSNGGIDHFVPPAGFRFRDDFLAENGYSPINEQVHILVRDGHIDFPRDGPHMPRTLMIGSVGLAALMASACVMKSTYDAAIMDLDAAKAELESTKAQKQSLTEEVATLETATKETTRQAETAVAAVLQARSEAEAEAKAADERLAKLRRLVAQLTAVQHSLHNALEAANHDARALKSTAERYQAKLDQMEGPRPSSFPPPPIAANDTPAPAPPMPSERPAQTQAQSDPLSTSPAAPLMSPTDTAPAKPSGQQKTQPETPTDDGWFSSIKGWLISLWHSVFS
jgi:hypothetical protein